MAVPLPFPSQPAAMQRLQQRPGVAYGRARLSAPTCSSSDSPTAQPRPALHDGGGAAPGLSRMQLVRGGLLAAGGMLIGAAAPASTAQAAAAVAAASEPALAAGAATEIAAAASQHFSKVGCIASNEVN